MDTGELALSDAEFAAIQALIHQAAGITLSQSKRTLVISRLSRLVRQAGCASFAQYTQRLKAGEGTERQAFVNALTTNLTRFYREEHHFEHLRQHVGRLLATRPRVNPDGRGRLRIWSAGCSTGQEAYTVALDLCAAFPQLQHWDFRILATDIDTKVLETGELGRYGLNDIEGLEPARRKLFEIEGGVVRVPGPVRTKVAFKPLNLNGAWPMRGPFDAIFCRNVAIYFDRPTQARLFGRLAEMLAPQGVLYIGHSEHIATPNTGLKLVGKTIYQARTAGKQAA